MLDQLKKAVEELPALLEDENNWHSLNIDYSAPVVQRVWTPWNGQRLMLHKIKPCGPGEALFHPHPWPSAVAIIRGQYEMGMGYGEGLEEPPITTRIIAGPGLAYEMLDINQWHYVRPIQETYTVMITGKPWDREMPKVDKQLETLEDHVKKDVLFTFRYHLDRWPIRIAGV